MLQLGEMYREGWGMAAVGRRARDYFTRVIAAGNAEGFRGMAQLYRYGVPGIEKDWAAAQEWYERAAVSDPWTFMEIRQLHACGGPRLVKNYATARDW